MLKVAVVTCYKDPDYVRSRALRAALHTVPGVEVLEVKNHYHNLFLRVPEVAYRLVREWNTERPDVYLLTFRGYELLPLTLLVAGRQPVIFDEFIQPVEVVAEHRQMKQGSPVAQLMGAWHLLAPLYYWLLRRCHTVLTDTEIHADYSAGLSSVPRDNYLALPVGTDESLFQPRKRDAKSDDDDTFQVFFYGNMVPLHGVRHVVAAAELLKNHKQIMFVLVGGGKRVAAQVEAANQRGAQIEYRPWIPFEELPAAIVQADVCLGGPFGDTVQSHNVVTGKTYQFLACAAPVIVGKSKATDSLFRDKDNSLVVQQGSGSALAKAIRWAWQHPNELEQIGKNGRKLYDQHFSNKQIAKSLRRVILPLVRANVTAPEPAE